MQAIKKTYLITAKTKAMNKAAVLVETAAAPAYLAVPQAGGQTGMIDSTHK